MGFIPLINLLNSVFLVYLSVKKSKTYQNDFFVDGLTNSIVNTISGDSFQTEISIFTKKDLIQVTKTNNWLFNWRKELKALDREVFKLTIENNLNVIQGLTSLTINHDHVFIHLVENAPFNRGKKKLYEGVPGNLVAYACKISFERGNQGFVSFTQKRN